MTFDEIVARARTVTPVERAALLRSLGSDERLAALLSLLADYHDGMVDGTCAQKLAGDPGKQSHGLGSIFALREFRAVLIEATRPTAPKRPVRRPDDEA